MTEQATLTTTWLAESLESALAGDDPVVRRHAAEALGHMRDGAVWAIQALTRVSLVDIDSGVRTAAVNALTEIGAPDESLLDNAVEMLEHDDRAIRARAGWAIGKLDPEVAARAISALGKCLAADPASDVRFGAAWTLGRIRSSNAEALEILGRALRDPVGDVRAEAARALGRTGRAASGLAPTLVVLLTDTDPVVREQVAVALSCIDLDTPGAIDGLRTLTTDPVDHVREAASKSLKLFDEPSATGGADISETAPAPVLEDAWASHDPRVLELTGRLLEDDDFRRAEASWLLAQLGGRAGDATTAQLITQALVDRDSDARWSAVHSIARIARRSPEVTRVTLRVLAHDRDPDVREAAAAALGTLWQEAPEEAVIGLIAALGDMDAFVREDAAESLGEIGPAAISARDALTRALDDPHGGVRARAAESLSILASAHLTVDG